MGRNRLGGETSPYLLQHADNPVDWWPWCDEAIEEARRTDRPILLSVGYSACHWCHVMAHESFEDERIASLMNRWFVNVKVDREERPDLDQIYQTSVQLMREGMGGWPLTVFLTPNLKPFWGGTYFPKEPRYGMPSFPQILQGIADAWEQRRDVAEEQGDTLLKHVARVTRPQERADGLPDEELFARLAEAVHARYDPRWGGFGTRPKFPSASNLSLMLRAWRRSGEEHLRDAALHTCDRMAAGGIYDHLGGGFHRYTVDERWLVPHFEKMLYDNASLLGLYTEAWQVAGHRRHAEVVAETVAYLLREMQAPEGGFYSTQDADSEGEEGRFFVWDLDEVREVLEPLGPDRADLFETVYGVTEAGNFEGRNILHVAMDPSEAARELGIPSAEVVPTLVRGRELLFGRREQRVRPDRDDKILTAWNGMLVGSMARAALAFDRPEWAEAASRAAAFLCDEMVRDDGSCLRSFKDGRARFDGYLDDHAALADGLTRLYEATGEGRWLETALLVAEAMISRFADGDSGRWFFSPPGREDVVVRLHSSWDASTPSGASMAAEALTRLSILTGRSDLHVLAVTTLAAHLPDATRNPAGFGHLLCAADLAMGPASEVVVAGDPAGRRRLLAEAVRLYAPRTVLAQLSARGEGPDALADGLVADRTADADGSARAWVCRDYACRTPTTDPDAVAATLVE
ncbi:MAG: thioredoxin domain-containing protein [Myxococcota bacterium]